MAGSVPTRFQRLAAPGVFSSILLALIESSVESAGPDQHSAAAAGLFYQAPFFLAPQLFHQPVKFLVADFYEPTMNLLCMLASGSVGSVSRYRHLLVPHSPMVLKLATGWSHYVCVCMCVCTCVMGEGCRCVSRNSRRAKRGVQGPRTTVLLLHRTNSRSNHTPDQSPTLIS